MNITLNGFNSVLCSFMFFYYSLYFLNLNKNTLKVNKSMFFVCSVPLIILELCVCQENGRVTVGLQLNLYI